MNAQDSLSHVGNVTASALGISVSPHQAGAAQTLCKGLRRTERCPPLGQGQQPNLKAEDVSYLFIISHQRQNTLQKAPAELLTKEVLPRLTVEWGVSSHKAHLEVRPHNHKMTSIWLRGYRVKEG